MTELILHTDPVLAAGGQAIGRAPDGRVVFVEGAAPNERIRVRVTKDNPRFLRARTVEVLARSPDRVEPLCSHFGTCGGCSLQHVSAKAQLHSKAVSVLTTLRKVGRVTPKTVLPAWQGRPYGYRGRARVSVTPDGRLGYRERRGRRIAIVDRCPVLHLALQAVWPATGDLRGRPGRPGRPGQPSRRGGPEGELHLVTDGEQVAAALTGGDGAVRRGLGDVEWPGPPVVDLGLETEAGWLHPLVFSQANPEGNRELRAQLDRWLASGGPYASAVELYAGSGNLTGVLAARSARTVTLEASADAVALARRVAPTNAEVRVATAEAAVAERAGPVDVVLVGPPRAGLPPEVADGVAAWATAAIAYVSCDPATFARDAGRWSKAGWSLEVVRVFDLYPQTAHVELMGWFTPTPGGEGTS